MSEKVYPLMFVFLLISCASVKERTEYILDWKGDGIGVEVTVNSPVDTLYYVYASENGGQKDQMTWFQDFSASNGRVTVDSSTRRITIVPENGIARFSYVVRCTLPEGYGSPGGCLMDVFRPDIDDKMLFSRTENIFAVPEDIDELSILDDIICKPMMGEYLLYYKGVLFGGIYDNRLLVKIVDGNSRYGLIEEIPYNGAKPMYLIDEIDNKELIKDIILDTCEELKKKNHDLLLNM